MILICCQNSKVEITKKGSFVPIMYIMIIVYCAIRILARHQSTNDEFIEHDVL